MLFRSLECQGRREAFSAHGSRETTTGDPSVTDIATSLASVPSGSATDSRYSPGRTQANLASPDASVSLVQARSIDTAAPSTGSPFFTMRIVCSMGDSPESIYGVLRLDLPLFEGGLRRAEVREAEARKRQADLSFADVQKTIGLQVAEAYLNVETQKGVLQSLTDQVTFARENFVMVEKQFRFGLASSLDVLDANTLLVTSERELSRARYSYQFAIVQLRRATGSLLETLNGSF